MAQDSCSTLLHVLYLPPVLMSVQYCGKAPQSQFRLLATPEASTRDGSSDDVLHLRLAYMPWQSTAAALVTGVGATVDGVGATVDDLGAATDDVAALDVEWAGATLDDALEVAAAEEGLTSTPWLHVHADGL